MAKSAGAAIQHCTSRSHHRCLRLHGNQVPFEEILAEKGFEVVWATQYDAVASRLMLALHCFTQCRAKQRMRIGSRQNKHGFAALVHQGAQDK